MNSLKFSSVRKQWLVYDHVNLQSTTPGGYQSSFIYCHCIGAGSLNATIQPFSSADRKWNKDLEPKQYTNKKKQSTFLHTSTIHLHYRSNATWIINHQWYVVLTSSLNNQWSNAIFQEKIMPSMLESCHSRAYIVTFPPAAYLSYLDETLKGHATVLHVTCSYLLGGKS
jgi:hypothetical protein